MKQKFKTITKVTVGLSLLIIVCFLLMIPSVANKAARVTGYAADTIRSIAATIAGIAIGLLLISFAVTAAAIPVLAISLAVIGLAILAYSAWPLISRNGSSKIPIGSSNLNSLGVNKAA